MQPISAKARTPSPEYAWYDGAEPGLSDSHSVTVNAEQFVFHLEMPSSVTITVTADNSLPNATLNPAFSVYKGILPDKAHDDQKPDEINPILPPFYVPIASEKDQAPGDPHVWKYLEDGRTPNPAFTPDIAAWYAQNYVAHNGYRDTLNFTTAGEATGYFGQFDAFGSWSMANPDGDWGKIEYISSVSNTPCNGPNCETTHSGGFDNPVHFTGNNGNQETMTLKLAAGDYSIWAGGESGNSANGKGGAPCVGVNEGQDVGCTETRAYATVQITATTLPNPQGKPFANAGTELAATSGDSVTLDGSGSSDPDPEQVLTYHWRQTAGPEVTLSDNDSTSAVSPRFTAPTVAAATILRFELHVTDNGSACVDTGNTGGHCSSEEAAKVNVTVNPVVENPQNPGSQNESTIHCFSAAPSRPRLWPARGSMKRVGIDGIVSQTPYRLTITGVTSDEPVRDRTARDHTGPDARIRKGKVNNKHTQAVDSVLLRAERQYKQKRDSGFGNGRVYAILFQAENGTDGCSGLVKVEVPPSRDQTAIDDGQNHDATRKK